MTRHERRKAVRARKNAKAEILERRALRVLQEEQSKRNLSMRGRPERSPKGMGNRGIYSGVGLYPTKGYGTGAFKPDIVSMNDSQTRVWRERIAARVDKAK